MEMPSALHDTTARPQLTKMHAQLSANGRLPTLRDDSPRTDAIRFEKQKGHIQICLDEQPKSGAI
jgi:hypothetical protein